MLKRALFITTFIVFGCSLVSVNAGEKKEEFLIKKQTIKAKREDKKKEKSKNPYDGKCLVPREE